MADRLDLALATLSQDFPGPGGAVAVVRDGQVLARQCWGYADITRRLPVSPRTLFRICSITKQFVCAAGLTMLDDLSQLDPHIRAAMPRLRGRTPQAIYLAHNQSGLRDYWASAMLCGASAESTFDAAASRWLIGRTASLQFEPGTRFSYCNQNFRLLGEALERHAGLGLDDLLRDTVFERVGMATARLVPDTATMPDGTQGYEGSIDSGVRPAVNRIHWAGDAGVVASLDDMIAWERFIDAARDDSDSLYQRLSAPVHFHNGAASRYGFGLERFEVAGLAATGHGGALRGWRSFRLHVPAGRLSVVVLFNHDADARRAAFGIAQAALDPNARPIAPFEAVPDKAWSGNFFEADSRLQVRLVAGPNRTVALYYSAVPEILTLDPEGVARGGNSALSRLPSGFFLRRIGDNMGNRLRPILPPSGRFYPPDGRFVCAELEATFTCAQSGGALYGGFSGALGAGEMQVLPQLGEDHWRYPMPRALDCAPPGEWMVHAHRDGAGGVAAVEIGCWLARKLVFVRQD